VTTILAALHARPPLATGTATVLDLLMVGAVVVLVFGGLAVSDLRRWLRRGDRNG
jgi:hypothetical protein